MENDGQLLEVESLNGAKFDEKKKTEIFEMVMPERWVLFKLQ